MSNIRDLPLEKVDAICRRIQKLYMLLVCLGVIGNMSRIFDFTHVSSRQEKLEGVIPLIIFICIYIGLRTRAKWVVSLILFSSAFGLLNYFVDGIHPALNTIHLISKSVDVMFVLFYTFQIIFFTKKEVKFLFGAKGTFIF